MFKLSNRAREWRKMEKKGIGKNAALAMVIVCIILAVSLAGAVANYSLIVNDKNTKIASQNSQIDDLQNQLAALETQITAQNTQIQDQKRQSSEKQAQIANLTIQINELNSQIESLQNGNNQQTSQVSDLQSQLDNLKAPRVINVGVGAYDQQGKSLDVYGWLCNIGVNTAYNVRVHVVAYQAGGVIAIDTYIVVQGIIASGEARQIDASVAYIGNALTSYTMTPEWTTTS